MVTEPTRSLPKAVRSPDMCKVLSAVVVLVAASLVDSRAAGPLLSPAGNVFKLPSSTPTTQHQEDPALIEHLQLPPNDHSSHQLSTMGPTESRNYGDFNGGMENEHGLLSAGIQKQQQNIFPQDLRQIANVREDKRTVADYQDIPMVNSQMSRETKPLAQQGTQQVSGETRQFPNMFENPILTYLLHQQKQDGSKSEAEESGNIRRKITHQQTIINPSPQFLQQLQQPSVHYQYPLPQQSNYPAAPPPGLAQQLMPVLQQQLSSSGDSQRNDLQQPPPGENYVTTLTLYPAIASVMFTHPAPSSTTYYPTPAPPSTTYPQASPQRMDLQSFKSISPIMAYSTRASWPFADYFPIIIKDPFAQMMNAITSMVEYGPEADVCRKDKTGRQGRNDMSTGVEPIAKFNEAGWKLFVNGEESGAADSNAKLIIERKAPEKEETAKEQGRKKEEEEEDNKETEVIMESEGKGTSGPFITRLMVRKGGVSIAGPGGIATAGSGGTAIVGPGGVAYTSPNGLAVVGPGAKVVGLPSEADLSALAASAKNAADSSMPRWLTLPPGGKLVATGPTVYYHPPETK